jgi:site-specific DNA-cytosine methylase
MITGAEQAMKFSEPRCIIVENAPKLFTPYGVPFAQRIANLAANYNYSMSMVKTSTIHHGLPQDRPRTFYFLWRGNKAPILNQISKAYTPFHEFMLNGDFPTSDLASKKAPPSTDPYWQFIVSKNPSLSKQEILQKYAGKTTVSVWMTIRRNDWIDDAILFMKAHGYEKQETWLKYAKGKLAQGLGVMDASVKMSWEKTRSLMWQTAPHTMHPFEDRWLSVTELLTLMGFPYDFYSKAPISQKDHNVICQNVPVCTAADWINEIAESFDGNREWVDIPHGKILRQSNITKNNTMKPVIS